MAGYSRAQGKKRGPGKQALGRWSEAAPEASAAETLPLSSQDIPPGKMSSKTLQPFRPLIKTSIPRRGSDRSGWGHVPQDTTPSHWRLGGLFCERNMAPSLKEEGMGEMSGLSSSGSVRPGNYLLRNCRKNALSWVGDCGH